MELSEANVTADLVRPVTPGVLMAGHNPVAFDAVGSTLMGFDLSTRFPW